MLVITENSRTINLEAATVGGSKFFNLVQETRYVVAMVNYEMIPAGETTKPRWVRTGLGPSLSCLSQRNGGEEWKLLLNGLSLSLDSTWQGKVKVRYLVPTQARLRPQTPLQFLR